jgi:hypothetical protein
MLFNLCLDSRTQLVKVRIVPPIAGIEPEPGDLVEAHRTNEVRAHAHGAVRRDATAALNTAVEFIDLFRLFSP